MQLTKVCVMALCTLLMSLAFSGVVCSAPEETVSVYSLEYGGLKIDVSAPIQAYPGENITVTVTAEAITKLYAK